MMEETGQVIKTEGETAIVQIARSSMCEKCNACQLSSSNTMQAEVENSIGAKVGDNVKIVLEPKVLLKAAFVIYVIPLVFFIFGYLFGLGIAFVLNKPGLLEALGIIFGFVFFGVSYMLIKRIDKKVAKTGKFKPVIVEVFRK
ncbi:MAG: SoxR reducing system RseC family protein [Actinobacteria bacterium]|nr:SoxR reducing system RseC family protein [Actinomycetota bacterium]